MFVNFEFIWHLKLKVAIKSLFMDVNLKKAIDDRRLHHQLIPTYAEIEEDFPIVNFRNLKKLIKIN